MSSETLQIFRFTIPAILFLLLFLPLAQDSLDIGELDRLLTGIQGTVLYLVFVAIFGTLYYIFDVRDLFTHHALSQIDDNIKNKLLKPFSDDPSISRQAARLRDDNTLMDIFYNIVDNDASLQRRATRVYFNGLLLSSAADILALSLLALVVYPLGFLILFRFHYLVITLVAGIAFILVQKFVLPRLIKKHIQLSDNQLDYITLHHIDQLRAGIQKALQQR